MKVKAKVTTEPLIVRCGCGFRATGPRLRKDARRHAEATGHTVTVIAKEVTTYTPEPDYPPEWPPTRGEVWEDRDGDRWVAVPNGPFTVLYAIGRTRNDSPNEVWRLHGPLVKVHHLAATRAEDEEPPF